MSDQAFEPIVLPAVKNYRGPMKHRRGAHLTTPRFKQSERRILIGLTSSALLVATALLLLLAASAHSEERPYIWPPSDEVVEPEGPWLPLGSEAAEEATGMTATSDDEEANR